MVLTGECPIEVGIRITFGGHHAFARLIRPGLDIVSLFALMSFDKHFTMGRPCPWQTSSTELWPVHWIGSDLQDLGFPETDLGHRSGIPARWPC